MTNTHTTARDFTDAARAYAREQADENDPLEYESRPDAFVDGIEIGAAWARDHLAAQEVTDEETGYAYAEWMRHGPIGDLDARRLNCTCGERGYTPSGYEHHRLRAALTAARTARQEETR